MPDYDVVIVGGGIHGVGVAQAVAAAGYRCAVIEQRALAWGTSSRSSKLIHGGLRYLESGQFGVVRECLRERAILLRVAPDLVRLKPFFIPVYRQTTRRAWRVLLGLGLYAGLSGWGREGRFDVVGRSRWGDLDGLDTTGLQQVLQYWDAQTDDARLTRAVMASAQGLGAELWSETELVSAELTADGVQLNLTHGAREFSLSARVLVNAAGPWAGIVLSKISPLQPPVPHELVQGSHLVLSEPLADRIYYVEAPADRRAVFVMPWQGGTMVGTTETPFKGDAATVTVLPEERQYLLDTLAHYFPRYRDTAPVIAGEFAGLRVLPSAAGTAFGRSRETRLVTDREDLPRVLSIFGGKLTAYRATAQRVLGRIVGCLPPRTALADTASLPLPLVD